MSVKLFTYAPLLLGDLAKLLLDVYFISEGRNAWPSSTTLLSPRACNSDPLPGPFGDASSRSQSNSSHMHNRHSAIWRSCCSTCTSFQRVGMLGLRRLPFAARAPAFPTLYLVRLVRRALDVSQTLHICAAVTWRFGEAAARRVLHFRGSECLAFVEYPSQPSRLQFRPSTWPVW